MASGNGGLGAHALPSVGRSGGPAAKRIRSLVPPAGGSRFPARPAGAYHRTAPSPSRALVLAGPRGGAAAVARGRSRRPVDCRDAPGGPPRAGPPPPGSASGFPGTGGNPPADPPGGGACPFPQRGGALRRPRRSGMVLPALAAPHRGGTGGMGGWTRRGPGADLRRVLSPTGTGRRDPPSHSAVAGRGRAGGSPAGGAAPGGPCPGHPPGFDPFAGRAGAGRGANRSCPVPRGWDLDLPSGWGAAGGTGSRAFSDRGTRGGPCPAVGLAASDGHASLAPSGACPRPVGDPSAGDGTGGYPAPPGPSRKGPLPGGPARN